MTSNNDDTDDLLNQLKDIFSSAISVDDKGSRPKEAVPLGTFVRSNKSDSLGIVTDSFYGALDSNNKKIIIYTILLLPSKKYGNKKGKYFLMNDYEYNVTAYLMIQPVDLNKLPLDMSMDMGTGGFLL